MQDLRKVLYDETSGQSVADSDKSVEKEKVKEEEKTASTG